MIGVLLVAGVGYLMGFRFPSFGGAVAAIALTIGIGYAFRGWAPRSPPSSATRRWWGC